MKNRLWKKIGATALSLATVLAMAGCGDSDKEAGSNAASIEITNVSYAPTRELYESYNEVFAKYWKEKTGQEVNVVQSHGGSGKQARSVLEGNEADVVTLALADDIHALVEGGMMDADWQKQFENNSCPYTSTIVFLVRKGNPKQINDWGDLIKEDVGVITPNPKTSGGARWNYLAAWAYAAQEYNGDEEQMKDFMNQLYGNVLVLDSGARGATTTFVENGQGDVLVAWENEAYLSILEQPDDFEIITPSISIYAEPPVAVVDEVADDRGTREVAEAYLEYLYSEEGQRIAGENFYRPSDEKVAEEFKDQFDYNMNLVSIDDELFGGWTAVAEKHFADGGIFDQIYEK